MRKISASYIFLPTAIFILTMFFVFSLLVVIVFASTTDLSALFDTFQARPPIHVFMGATTMPLGLAPSDVRSSYHLPTSGGSGTIAIVSAFHHKDVESDLAAFNVRFSLPACTIGNKCLEIHTMSTSGHVDSGWDMETALDTEWSHAIAPKAKILLVEAMSDNGTNLMRAVDYATSRKDVVSVSMSWGGMEFAGETKLDSHFQIGGGKSKSSAPNPKLAFFASSGDDGSGVSWPASSPNVVSVGGTRLVIGKSTSKSGKVTASVRSESAWSGSGGGVSQYEPEPTFQSNYSIPRSAGMRAIPDVSYAADPVYGFSVYHDGKWYIIGGTSAGAPQWAAIHALGKSVLLSTLYADKAASNSSDYFRDIVSGKNGSCAYFCVARKRYDYVTGLGSPVT